VLALVASACAPHAPSTLVVLPFTVEGAPDSGAVRDLAGRTQGQLETALRSTQGIVWLPLDVRQRPPDPKSGKPSAARLALRCVAQPESAGIRIRWHVIVVGNGSILGTEGIDVQADGEAAAAAAIAMRRRRLA